MENVSLLWKDDNRKFTKINENVFHDMGVNYLINAVFDDESQRKYASERLSEMIMDEETIRYRQEIFNEIFENEQLRNSLSEALDKLVSLDMVQNSNVGVEKKSGLLKLVDRMSELYMYLDVVLALNKGLSAAPLKSQGLKKIYAIVSDICKNKGFEQMQQDIYDIKKEVSDYKSLTIGVNLDSLMNVEEVMILSVNDYKHKVKIPMLKRFGYALQETVAMNQMIDPNMVKKYRKKKEIEHDPIMMNLQHIFQTEMQDLTNNLWRTLKKYVDVSGSSLTQLIPELQFYFGFVKFFLKIKNWGYPVCMPEFLESDVSNLKIEDCYNIKLLLSNADDNGKCDIVYNSIDFNPESNIFILTGPNSGGKTTFTEAVGCCVILAQQGLAVFASQYKGRTFDSIYTHFPASEEDTVNFGRLGEEANRIGIIMKKATGRSFVLLNETYSSTSFSEGLFLADDLLKAMKYKGIASIYNTHMHELAQQIDEINAKEGPGMVDSLVMGVTQDGKRSYKVYRKKPDGNSYAKDIALKYGVTYEQLIS